MLGFSPVGAASVQRLSPTPMRKLGEMVPAPALAPAVSASSAPWFPRWLSELLTPDLGTKVWGSVAAWLLLRQLQAIFGPMRRSSGHWFVQYMAMAAYHLPSAVVFYAAGAAYSSAPGYSKASASVICFFLVILSSQSPIVMTAYALRDGPLQRWRLLRWMLLLIWLQLDITVSNAKTTDSKALPRIVYLCLSYGFFLLCIVLVKPEVAPLDSETKAFADYMMQESRSESPFFDDDGCKYPFMDREDDGYSMDSEDDGHWITVKDVVQNCHPRQLDPDICLSYSLCRLIARRYFGFLCAEEGNAQVRDFMLTQLLTDYKRAFTIVEVQLAFLHDYFFTTYRPYLNRALLSIDQAVMLLLLMIVIGGVAFSCLYSLLSRKFDTDSVIAGAVGGPLLSLVFMQPKFPVLPMYWHPIRTAFKYYSTTAACSKLSVIDRFVPPRCNPVPQQYSYWRGKLGQYSLIHDYDHRSIRKSIMVWFRQHILSQVSSSFIKHHTIQEEDISVPDSVRRLIASALRDTDGLPTNGARSLLRNRDRVQHDWSWTLSQETHTDTILIWHIATCYCDMSLDRGSWTGSLEMPEEIRTFHEAAMTLSRYCVYLVAFLPELLPENSLTTQFVLQDVLEDAQRVLGRRKTRMPMGEKRARIRGLELQPTDEQTTFGKGVMLGRQLEELDSSLQWEVMADFWAETIVYVAPSDNAAAHVEQLAKGGEFVTHLWAMLSNAGVLKRATEEGNQPPAPVVSSFHVESHGGAGSAPLPRPVRSSFEIESHGGARRSAAA